MTGRALTLVELDERRRERDQVRHQLAQIAPLKRRLAHLERELLDGVAYPLPGASAEQLPLAAPLSQRVLEALRAAKARRSADVLATLLGESSERVHEAIVELIAAGLARSARRGGYEATNKPETAPRTGRNAKPEKVAPKATTGPALWKPGHKPGILPGLTPAGTRRVLELLKAAPGGRMAKADICKRLSLPDDTCMPTGVCYQSGDWVLKEAPAKVKKAAKKAKPKKPATTAARTLTDDIEAVLGEWGSWLDVAHLEAKVREALPLGLGPSTREWEETLTALLEAKKLERKYEYGRALFRLATPASEAKPSKPRPKKASKAPSPKASKAPSPPPPTLPVKGAMAKILADFSIDQWAQARAEVCEKIAQKKGVSVAVGPLLLSLTCESILLGPVLELLDAAGAVTVGYRGKTPAVVTPGAKVGDEEIAADLQALSRRYVLDLVDDRAEPPTTDDLAASLELPHALIASVLIELRAAEELLCDREGRWSVRSPKASAAARTAPLFDDVEPAPAVDGLEPEGDVS